MKLPRHGDIGLFDCLTTLELVCNVANSETIGRPVTFSEFSVQSLELNRVIDLVERLYAISKAIFKEVP